MADVLIQRVVFPRDFKLAPLYYRVRGDPPPASGPGPAPLDRRSIVLDRGMRIETNTYFNSFFETCWRRHTTLDRLVLRLRLAGTGTVRLWRMGRDGAAAEVGHASFDGEDLTVDLEVPEPQTDLRECGTLYFEVLAGSRSVRIVSAEWLAMDAEPKRVEVVAGYCTFNRERFVLDNIRSLTQDPDLKGCLAQIVVVDQGTSKVKDHPEFRNLPPQALSRTSFFDQPNFGGAGGFTRCILEAIRLNGATHVLLLDDDATIEPESVLRTAAFLSLAKDEIAVGGPMLDLLRPMEMYEAGGFVLPATMGVGGWGRHLSLDDPRQVHSLAAVHHCDYNAWWFFAFPLSVVHRVGLPLPLFIRCDDLEFGNRLRRAGVPTLTLPGLGVWHVPFYLKKRGWEFYYDVRNMLAVIALHFPVSRISVARVFLRILVNRLLTLDYFRAWALCEGIDDYLSGPSILTEDPQGTHKRLQEVHRRLSPGSLSKTRRTAAGKAPGMPRSSLGYVLAVLSALAWHVFRASPARAAPPSRALHADDERWYALCNADVVAIDDPRSSVYVVLRRNRGRFFGLLARGLWSILRLLFTHASAVRKWQAGWRPLSEVGFWQRYLDLADPGTEPLP